MKTRSSALAVLMMAASPGAAIAAVDTIETEAGPVEVVRLADGLVNPWGMVFLPDGRLLVTEREGRLRILFQDGTLGEPLAGIPEVFNQGQGGLLDVAIDPDFEENGYVYLSFAEPGEAGRASTALGRGRLADGALDGFEVIFRQEPKVEGPNHFGGRIVFSPDGFLFLTTGERFKFDPAQDLTNHLGTIVRLRPDGTVPDSNPFVGEADALPEIWSYGHRNVEAAIWHPQTDALWIGEMGPLGGDELNRIEKGANYGWPVVSWGRNYLGEPIPDPPTRPEFEDSAMQWTPVISPSGMALYDGELFPEWAGSVFLGSLSDQSLVRVAITGDGAEELERLPLGARIRDVTVAPDGSLYVATDESDGSILRLAPLERE